MTHQSIWLDHAMRKRDRIRAQRVSTIKSVWHAMGLAGQVVVGLATGVAIGLGIAIFLLAFTVNHA